jgi:capsular polysaccharide biosynthesis protein
LNEDQVIELLKKLPGTTHEVVDWAELSGREQAIKAARADIFVGMHGAGLTHIQYAHEDAVLVELHAMYVVGTRARTLKNPCFLNPIQYGCQVSLRTAVFPVLLPKPRQVAGYAVLRMAQHHRQ